MAETQTTELLIIGAGASGLICALTAARRGKKVLILDHRQRPGDRVAISGGGSCNFSNRTISPEDFVTRNPRFLYSPLKAFPTEAAVRFFSELGLSAVEREYGQLFFRQGGDTARNALVEACLKAGCQIQLSAHITEVIRDNDVFRVFCKHRVIDCDRLVLACGGLSYPGLGASDLGYSLARRFGHHIIPTAPGLVPLLYSERDLPRFSPLSGISLRVSCRIKKQRFHGDLLFTRKGLSGPVILTASNSWSRGMEIFIDWLPDLNLDTMLVGWRTDSPKTRLRPHLATLIPRRVLDTLIPSALLDRPCSQVNRSDTQLLHGILHATGLTPARTDGYEKAEVTKGGIDTREIDNRTMQSRIMSHLYIIGELLDITGNLGGFNLHWAWCSGYLAGIAQ